MGNPNSLSCSTCDYYIDSGDGISGKCVWAPPEPAVQNWAPVKATDWCGHYQITPPSGPGGNGVWASYTPTVLSTGGAFGSVAGAGRWILVGKTLFIRVRVVITTVGTASGALTFTLPVNTGSNGIQNVVPGYGYSGTDAWKPWSANGANNVSLLTANDYTQGFVVSNGDILLFEGFYEID